MKTRHGAIWLRRLAVGSAAGIVALLGAPVKAQPPVMSPPPPTATASGPHLSLSLVEAVFLGLRDNRTVKSAYIARVAQKYDLFVAETRFRPTAVLAASSQSTWQGGLGGATTMINPTATWLAPTGAQFQFGWTRSDTHSPGADQISEVASLSVKQPLLKGGGLAVNAAPIRVAELQERINHLTLKSAVIDTVTSIILAYRNLLQAQEQLVITKESLDRSRAQLQTNQAMIDAGRMAAAEIVQTQADIANQQVAALQAEQQRNSAQLALLSLLAMDLHTNIVASDHLRADNVAVDLDQAVAIALDNRPDYLSQQRALEQARQALIVAKNNRLWSLSVIGEVQRQTLSGAGSLVVNPATGLLAPAASLSGTSGSVGLQLSIPLGDYTLEQGEVQATTNLRTQEIELEDLRQTVEAQVRDAVQGVEMARRQVEAARQARDLAARTLDLERTRLEVGRASNFEVLSFEANLRAADIQALSATITYLNALTGLDQQLGATLDTWKIQLND